MKSKIWSLLILSMVMNGFVFAGGEISDSASTETIPVGSTLDITQTIVFAPGAAEKVIGKEGRYTCSFVFGESNVPSNSQKIDPTVLPLRDVFATKSDTIHFFLKGTRMDMSHAFSIRCYNAKRYAFPSVGTFRGILAKMGIRLTTSVVDAMDAEPMKF